jgi:hypothetical protein
MAYTDSTGFIYRRPLLGSDQPVVMNFRIGDSATLKIGDAVRINTSGLIVRAEAGNPVLGILRGICDKAGINPFSAGYINGLGATLTGDDTVVSASDNSSRAEYAQARVQLDIAGCNLWYNDANGDLAQTNVGQLFDVVAASGQIDQSVASDTSGQFQLLQLDPDGDGDASKGLFRIAEPQLLNHVGNATEILVA